MVYDPSRELHQLRQDIEAQSGEVRRLIEEGKRAEAKKAGQKMDQMQKRKAKLELAVKRFQGPV